MKEPSHRAILSIALPMTASNLSVPLLGAVDTAVMGHLPGPQYIGAVAVGATIFSFVFWTFGFLRMGTTGLVAQAQGAEDPVETWAVLLRATGMAFAAAGLVWVLQWPLREAGLWFADAPAQVELLARDYFQVRIWSAPAVLLNYVAVGWLLGMQAPRRALAVLLTINLTNIVLDFVFVLHFGWGVRGVAAASVAAELLGSVLAVLLVSRVLRARGIQAQGVWRFLLELKGYSRMMAVGRDIMIRTLLLIFSFAFFVRQSAALGAITLAANSVALQFVYLMSYCVDGFAQAAEVFSGRYWGAADKAAFQRATRRTGLWCGAVAGTASLVFAAFGAPLYGLMTNLNEVQVLISEYWIWVIVIPPIAAWSFLLDGVYIGATWTRPMRQIMLASTLTYLAAWYLLQPWGNHGIWLALVVFYAARGVGMALWYPRCLRSVQTTSGV